MYVHKMERNVYCPTEYGVNIFGGKWKPRILCLLNIKGVCRYREIKQLTPGISDNVLAGVMKELITAQLVERKQYDEVPLRVEYSLTDKGKKLIPVLHSICHWVADSYGAGVMGTANTCPYVALAKELND
ncbi:MAG: helix-turn-helix transcriptional regulator [Oscillospiraceae bacterium]|nr:helix-turn-helix transcriptional regulator [Oscillospiraceae bacterium]